MIALRGVTKRFGSLVALDAVSIEVPAATTHVLLGSSGCGKSTVLRLILGLAAADEGTVVVDDILVDATSREALVRRMGYVVQDGGLYPHLTAADNAALAAETLRWTRPRIAARLAELAAMVHLDRDALGRYPSQLSGGQRQRVGLMRALMLDPPILLMDEPLGALDPLVRAELQGHLASLFETLGKTVVLVTHDLREAARLGASITLLHAGRVIQQGTFADLAERPATAFVREFVTAQALAP